MATLLYRSKYLVTNANTLALLSERKYNSAQKVEPINRILVPALVFFVENIIELHPQFDVLIDLELQARAQVRGHGKVIGLPLLRKGPGAIKYVQA